MRLKIVCLLACLSVYVLACGEKKTAQAPAPPPPAVTVVETKAQDIPIYSEFVGETHGLKDIAIRARVEGFLEGIHFQEGGPVKKGELLYTLESQPFEEKVAAQRSAVAEQQTFLAKAKGDLDRIRPLAEINAVSQSDLDEAVAAYEARLSSVEAAKANLRAAEIQLGYTRIRSPIDGIIGQTQAKVGDFVGRDPNPVILNTVSQVDTILVTFFITENQYLELARYLSQAKAQTVREENLQIQLILSDESVYNHPGKLDFVNREVDTATGAMLVQASFPNPERLLRPGQFTKVRIKSRVVKDGILIPQRCVMEVQGLFNVYVVDGDDTAHTREISVGPKIGSDWLISEGLKPGERVIYEGLQKVKDGAKVKPTVVAPTNSTGSADQGKK
jgi:membrane fusion protein (multidrug efflux system)